MPQLVTDPRILELLNAPDPMPAAPGASPYGALAPTSAAPPDAAPAPSQGSPGAFSAPPVGMTRVTDPAILAQLNAPDNHPTPGVRFATAPQGAPGQDGLVWDKDGGRDPKTGELVVGGKPMTQTAPSQTLAGSSSFLSGIPIAGPYIERGMERLSAAMHDGPADQVDAAIKDRVATSQAAYPKTSTAASIGGAVVGTLPMIEMAPAAFGVGPGGLTLGKVAAGAGSGTVIGASDAAVRSGGDLGAIERGAAAGAIGGAAGPPLGAIASQAGRGVANLVGYYGNCGTGLSAPVRQTLTRSAEADGALGPEGIARIREAGPGAMLADVGPASAGALDTALQRGGPGSTAARQAIEQRAADANRELTVHLDRTFGPEQGLHTAETAIRIGSAPARSAAYARAYASSIDFSSPQGRALQALVSRHVPANAIAQANALIRADPTAGPAEQMFARMSPDGSMMLDQPPTVRQLDYLTRGLNDVAAGENAKGALGGTTQLGNTYANLSRAIRGQLRQAVPAYGDALDTAADPIAARNALQFGSELLRSSTPRDVAAETIRDMTGPELAQARSGLRSAIAEKLSNVRRTAADGNIDARQAQELLKDLSSDAARQKITMLADPREAPAMLAALDREARALTLRAATATNSRTAGRTMTNEAVKASTERPVLDAALGMQPLATTGGVLRQLFGRSPADIARHQDTVYGDLARTLTEPRGPAAEGILDRLIRAHQISTGAHSVAGNIPFGALSQTGLLALLPPLNQRAQ